jgi:hypothetical protein
MTFWDDDVTRDVVPVETPSNHTWDASVDEKTRKAMAALTASGAFLRLVTQVAQMEQTSLALGERSISTQEEEAGYVEVVVRIQTLMNEVEMQRKTVVAFPRMFLETVNGLFGTPTSSKGLYPSLKRAKERVERVVLTFGREKEAARKAEFERAEAERMATLMDVAQGKTTIEEAIEKGVEAPPPMEEESTKVEAPSGSGSVSARGRVDFNVYNVRLFLGAVVDGIVPAECVSVKVMKAEMRKWLKG